MSVRMLTSRTGTRGLIATASMWSTCFHGWREGPRNTLHLDQKIQNRLKDMGPVEAEVAEKGKGLHLSIKGLQESSKSGMLAIKVSKVNELRREHTSCPH